jgi:hypothetical protein
MQPVSDGSTHTSATTARMTPPRWNVTRFSDFIVPIFRDGRLDHTS